MTNNLAEDQRGRGRGSGGEDVGGAGGSQRVEQEHLKISVPGLECPRLKGDSQASATTDVGINERCREDEGLSTTDRSEMPVTMMIMIQQ